MLLASPSLQRQKEKEMAEKAKKDQELRYDCQMVLSPSQPLQYNGKLVSGRTEMVGSYGGGSYLH